ncbi:MAG TPA: hypothetical protein VF316_10755, partial [Polyangiaceae bacterium]
MSLDASHVGASADALLDPRSLPDEERFRRFGEELDTVKQRVFSRVGAEDVAYVKRLDSFSVAMEVIGRVLIHVSPEPVTFLLGVGALYLHKQL